MALLNNNQVVCQRQSCWSYVAPSSALSVYYDKICIEFASHHLLLCVVYMCQKSLNFTYAFKCYQQKCKWLHFSWATLLQWRTNRKSELFSKTHTFKFLESCSVDWVSFGKELFYGLSNRAIFNTFNDSNPDFKVRSSFDAEYLRNG